MLKKIVIKMFITILVISVLMFMAYIERGYITLGGEFVGAIFGTIALIDSVIKDLKENKQCIK